MEGAGGNKLSHAAVAVAIIIYIYIHRSPMQSILHIVTYALHRVYSPIVG